MPVTASDMIAEIIKEPADIVNRSRPRAPMTDLPPAMIYENSELSEQLDDIDRANFIRLLP